jgi:hypothetical protein
VPQPPTAEELDELRVDLSQGLETGTCHRFLCRRATLGLPSSRPDSEPTGPDPGLKRVRRVSRLSCLPPPRSFPDHHVHAGLPGPGPHQPGNGGSTQGGPPWVSYVGVLCQMRLPGRSEPARRAPLDSTRLGDGASRNNGATSSSGAKLTVAALALDADSHGARPGGTSGAFSWRCPRWAV